LPLPFLNNLKPVLSGVLRPVLLETFKGESYVGDLSAGEFRRLTADLFKLSFQTREDRIEEMCGYLNEQSWGARRTDSYISRTYIMKRLLTSGYWVGSVESKERIVDTVKQLVLSDNPEESVDVLRIIVGELGVHLFQDKLLVENGMKATCKGTVVFPLKNEHRQVFETCLEELAGFHERKLAPYTIQAMAQETLFALREGERPAYWYESMNKPGEFSTR
jgi:hypothetical protein